MNSIWITAWIISAVIALGVWMCARRGGLAWMESFILTAGFFPAPLFVAIGGSNSFIYAFDLVVPLALFLAIKRWPRIPRPARRAAVWLAAGVGLAPLVVLFAMADRLNVMYSAISFYRLVGAIALMCVLSETAVGLDKGRDWLLAAFSWMNVILVVAALLQSQGWINSNVFYNAVEDASLEGNESMRFITAGLFRGSLGIIGVLGWVAFLAQYNVGGWRAALALAGGVAGTLQIVLCGSKTSLLAVLFITVAGCALFPQILRHLWGRLASLSLALVLVGGAYLLRLDSEYFSYTLGVLGLADESLGTLDYRQQRWKEAMDFVAREPGVLVGAATPFGKEERGLSYFHNEYVTMLMGGGFWSAGAYLVGLLIVATTVFRQRARAGNGQVFAALTLMSGLIQALTVNHLLPGIFFACTTTIITCGYGLGFAESVEVETNLEELEASEVDDPEFTEPPLETVRS
jgi:hypothetical protein